MHVKIPKKIMDAGIGNLQNYLKQAIATRQQWMSSGNTNVNYKMLADCKRITAKRYIEHRGQYDAIYYNVIFEMPDGSRVRRELGPFKYNGPDEQKEATEGARFARELEVWCWKELKARQANSINFQI